MRQEVDRREELYDERAVRTAGMIDRRMQRDGLPAARPHFLGNLAAAGSETARDLRAPITRAERLGTKGPAQARASVGHDAATIRARPMNRGRRPSARIGTCAAARGRVERLPDAGCDAGPPAMQAFGPMPRVESAGSIPAATSEGPR